MEVAITPRESVLQYGVLPINVTLPQLDCIASLHDLVATLSAAAVTDEQGQRVISVSDAADALGIDQQQCQLLFDTLAAVRLSPPAPTAAPCSSVTMHELALFLLVQLYGRDSHKMETQDHWPEPSAPASIRAAAAATAGPAGSPLVNAQASRLLIKSQLQQQQKQHQAYARGYAEFLQKHHRALMEFVLDDPTPLQQWRKQRQLMKQQKEQQKQKQQQQLPPDKQPGEEGAGGQPEQQSTDVHMEPVGPDAGAPDVGPAAAASDPALAGASGAGEAGKDMALEGVSSESPLSLQQQPVAGSVASHSTCSLISLHSTLGRVGSLPALVVSAKELDRLGFLLQVYTNEGLVALPSIGGAISAAGAEGAADAAAQQQQQQEDEAATANGGSSSALRGPQLLSSAMPAFQLGQQGALLEEVMNWLSSSSQQLWQQQTLTTCGSLWRVASGSTSVVGGGSTVGGVHAPGTIIAAGQSAVSAWLYGAAEQEPAAGAAAAQAAVASSSNPVAAAAAELTPARSSSPAAQEAVGATRTPPPVLGVAISPLTQASPAPGDGGLSPMPSLGATSPFSLGPPAMAQADGSGPTTPTAGQQQHHHLGGSLLALAGAGSGGSAPGTPNGHLSPVVQQQLQLGLVAPVLSPVRTRLSPAAAAPGSCNTSSGGALNAGTQHLTGTLRVNARGMTAVAGGVLDHRGIQGVYRGSVVQGPSDVDADAEMLIQDCTECHIYVLAPLRRACVSNCSDCTVILGAVGTLLRLENCERLQLVAAAGQVQVISCHSCTLYLGTVKPPVLLGDCRFVTLAPHNTRYEFINEHLAAAGLPTGVVSLWNQPILVANSRDGSVRKPVGATPSSPLTHGAGAGGAGGSSGPKPMLLMPPEDFLPIVVPFRGAPGTLAGGVASSLSSQWTRGSHKQQSGPLPPWPFVLPAAYDQALESKYAVVTELKGRIKGSGLDDVKRGQLQNIIQAFFREWLHSSGHIRAVYDLQKLEADEVNPSVSGGSPTHHF